ncbi:hypothetical protein R4E38_02590 [Morganella morganii]|uniref:hypothetical protein n=1 Tax=Morganella morganii TaxID=582 RepID=UPI0011403505|nr:hypothetical protein [Morganella morganii]EJK8625370.1 hypothetical protein [Morganella morganii]EKW5729299.1 hypothetical protein [Morganella morganii]MBT0422966.1 hypothetical protein [Morganella morganii subsp. morganii]MBT0505033.1 hypothetical protein [Morganella morganii subsp. morganii]MBT0517564.1 hypothetical protein [Morganella morganii subsp. morganii]
MAIGLISITELDFISVERNHLFYDREKSVSEETTISLEISVSISERSDGSDQCKITMDVNLSGTEESENKDDPDIETIKLDMSVDYIFDIKDREAFDSFTDEDKTSTLSHMVYLDFRRRIMMSMASIGATRFSMPLALSKIQK